MDDKFNNQNNGGFPDDDFFEKLRSDSSLNDMQTAEGEHVSFRESETDREPVSYTENADMVLFDSDADKDAGTTVFQADSAKTRKPTGTGKKTGSKAASAKGAAGGKKETGKKKRPDPWWKKVLRIAVYAMCVVAVGVCVVAIAAAMYLSKVTADDEVLLDLNAVKLSFSSVIEYQDKESGEWVEYARIFDEENRIWVDYSDFPKQLIDATIASEDQHFWTHNGIDFRRTVFAFINEYLFRMSEETQGGSTITQQLIKNITDDDDVQGTSGALRKLREIYRAYQLERRFTKEQILEAYLNTMNVGGQVAGIEAGANYYFGIATKDLTVAQSAAIVCITKYPSANNPFLNPDTNKVKRNDVIYFMNQYGLLSDADYQAALAESESFVFDQPHNVTSGVTGVNSWFTDMVINDVLNDLQEIKNLDYSDAYNLLYNGGLKIRITMDPEIQEVVERVALDAPDESGNTVFPGLDYITTEEQAEAEGANVGDPAKNQIQAAIVVMNYEGEILGIAGGIREKTESLSLNRAVDSVRPTGSAMKPIAVYGPAIEFNTIHYSTLLADSASEVINGKPWPSNFDNTYGAAKTVYDAIRVSLNTTSVLALKTIGYDVAFDYLESRLGITSLVDRREDPSGGSDLTDKALAPMAVGALTDGISPLEMCAAYASFGNGGTYTEPHSYTEVWQGAELVIDKKATLLRTQAFSEQTAYIMNRLLLGVMQSGTGVNARPRNTNLDYIGKSGTTSDYYDMWFVGMNPYYICTTWMGYDEPKYYRPGSPRQTQVAFRAVMTEISADLEFMEFPTASGITRMTFCRATGLIATDACPEKLTGYYKDGYAPEEYCTHQFVPVDPNEGT